MKHELVASIVAEAELTSDCTCEDWDTDTDTMTPAESCWGCFDDAKDNFQFSVLEPWLKANDWDTETLVHVFGANMNWNRVSGWTDVRASELLDSVTLNGDFKLRFVLLDDNSLICVRSSHDELGAIFVFDKAREDREETP